MNILVAPNAFKNSLAAGDAAMAIAEGLEQSKLRCKVHEFPIADGGDGTADLLVKYFKGSTVTAAVHDPLGRKISCPYGVIDGGRTAVIEMANASGLRLLNSNELDPLRASSFGTGELMLHAMEKGVDKIILCIGGSATVDGGSGMLQALGFRFIGETGEEIKAIPELLSKSVSIDVSGVANKVHQCKFIVLCDVENYLLGAQGAAAVFGPQKGASPRDVATLEDRLAQFRNIVLRQTGKDMATTRHGGAAGGIAAGLHALLNAELVNGIDYFLDVTKFGQALEGMDLVVTGEGSIDEQTLQGKGPYGVAKRAKDKQLPVIALAGRIPEKPSKVLDQYFDVMLSIVNEPAERADVMRAARENLVRTAKTVGNLLAFR